MIKNLTIGDLTIDCANAERARDFYADVKGWEKTTAYGALAVKTNNGMTILFWEPDIPYEPPVWPEEPEKQQKQMHLDFTVDDIASAVEKAIRLGAAKAATQYGDWVTMLDPDGHPFCLCEKAESNSVKNEVDLFFKEKGYGGIPDISINIDCPKSKTLYEFYAQLTGWDQLLHWAVIIADNGMIVCFRGVTMTQLWTNIYHPYGRKNRGTSRNKCTSISKWTNCNPLWKKLSVLVRTKPRSSMAAIISLRCLIRRGICFVCAGEVTHEY